MLPPWTWTFIKSIPDSSVCSYQVRIFMFSSIAIVNVKFSGPFSDAVYLFYLTSLTLLFFFLQTLCSFFDFYNHFISPYLLYSVIFLLYLWKGNLLNILSFIVFLLFFCTHNILSCVKPSVYPCSFVLRIHLSMLSLILFNSASSFAQTSTFFLLPLQACS